MEANLSEWFEREVKPAHVGVYEVRVKANGKIVRWFSYWNGTFWGMSSNTPGAAYVLRETPSDAAEHAGGFEWRGLTEKPWSEQKHLHRTRELIAKFYP